MAATPTFGVATMCAVRGARLLSTRTSGDVLGRGSPGPQWRRLGVFGVSGNARVTARTDNRGVVEYQHVRRAIERMMPASPPRAASVGVDDRRRDGWPVGRRHTRRSSPTRRVNWVRWVITAAATAASALVLDVIASAAGVLLVATRVLDDTSLDVLLAVLASTYGLWAAGLRANVVANGQLLEATGTSTNVLSKLTFRRREAPSVEPTGSSGGVGCRLRRPRGDQGDSLLHGSVRFGAADRRRRRRRGDHLPCWDQSRRRRLRGRPCRPDPPRPRLENKAHGATAAGLEARRDCGMKITVAAAIGQGRTELSAFDQRARRRRCCELQPRPAELGDPAAQHGGRCQRRPAEPAGDVG